MRMTWTMAPPAYVESRFYKELMELMDCQETIVTRKEGAQPFFRYEDDIHKLEKILNLRRYVICA